MPMTSPQSTLQLSGLGKLASIRTKFVVFFSLILILTSSALSWYFIEVRRVSMTENLNQLGTILLTSVVNNGQFRYGGLIAEDRATLQQFVESLMAIDDVVYVVVRGADHIIRVHGGTPMDVCRNERFNGFAQHVQPSNVLHTELGVVQ